jgi:pimeloyl-ACP methyl ester carboxylesterase
LTQAGWANAFAAAIERDGLEAAGARFAWGAESGFDLATADLVRRGFLEHAPHAIRGLLLSVLATQLSAAELAPRLRTLDVPVLVIVGGRDALSLAPSRVLARALPRARLVEVRDAGHVVNLAAPRAFDAALLEFVEEIDAREHG